ncbi:UPF0764 protein C16orf89 homolog [Trichonephila inaurata madagascariensis]|uniref:UPF0764 protein C16orf89 homolog n=1 Tax=Trichonephila inaurata madagascariensis TaxID=2747483 RepID=A0A8X6YGF0_9ARAC|nr:UPF0764 protein C16orf89 homolog [Trichonephila inaurata madagascariensis]
MSAATGQSLLDRTLNSLGLTLQYMENQVSELNLDGVFCIRRVEEQLQAFLKHEPQVFRRIHSQILVLVDKARRLADKGILSIEKKEPEYASSVSNNSNPCYISAWCVEDKSKPRQRDYILTHQVLFWQLAEMWQCIRQVPETIRDRLCSNVLRDAEMTERMSFPTPFADLFLEQIGLCGLWGYKDFNKPEFLRKVLEWQQPSGCYTGSSYFRCLDVSTSEMPRRVKRTEKILSDGCLAHKTGVALLALTANVRFEAEKEYFQMPGNIIQ